MESRMGRLSPLGSRVHNETFVALADFSSGIDAQVGSHANEIGDGIRLHLLEHLVPVNLDRSFGDAEVVTHLLIQLTANQVSEYFPLARRQAFVTTPRPDLSRSHDPICFVAGNRAGNGLKEHRAL